MSKCKRCGECCHYEKEGKIKKCKYLILHGNTASCRIYPNRINIQIDDGMYCGIVGANNGKAGECIHADRSNQ